MPRIIEHEYTGASNTYGVRCRCGVQSFQFYEEPSLAANAWNARKGEPSADVEPVRRGRWQITDAYPHTVYCSECHKRYAQTHWSVWEDGSLPREYCPNCGARMDGEQDA